MASSSNLIPWLFAACCQPRTTRKPKESDIHAASTFCLRNGLPMSSECFAREFVPERAAEGRTRPTLRRRAASSSACKGGQRGELRSGDAILARRSKVSLVPDMAREQAQGGESDCLELYRCLLALLCTDGVTRALSRRAAQNYASSWITPRL